jgi:MarR family transcriptional regulator, 2-MHQ and catechol-resistance regulon repressor
MNRTPIIKEVLEGLHVLQQKVIARQRIPKGLELITFSEWRVLEVLHTKEGATIKDIHTTLSITSSAATQLVNNLVRKKYVVRKTHSQDRRASSIMLSSTMKSSLKRIVEQHFKNMQELFQVLSDEEFITFTTLHKKIITSIT